MNATKTLNVRTIAAEFGIKPKEVNIVLAELGYQKKGEKGGWILLRENFGEQKVFKNDKEENIPFVVWNEQILKNKRVIEAIDSYLGYPADKADKKEVPVKKDGDKKPFKFDRDTFKAEFRAMDGHNVRSQGEIIVDNWLYMNGFVHAYERRVPIEEELYCDFYLPTHKIYIEYEGLVGTDKYDERQEKKRALYSKYGLKLIELFPEDIKNIDDVLPLKLLKFGVQVV